MIWAAFLAKSYVALRLPSKKRTLPYYIALEKGLPVHVRELATNHNGRGAGNSRNLSSPFAPGFEAAD